MLRFILGLILISAFLGLIVAIPIGFLLGILAAFVTFFVVTSVAFLVFCLIQKDND